MRIIVSGDRADEEVIAESFTIEGSDEQFAVHHALGADAVERGRFAATHVDTGFAIARADTIDGAIEAGRAAWAARTPEQVKAALIRACAIRTTRIAEQQVPA